MRIKPLITILILAAIGIPGCLAIGWLFGRLTRPASPARHMVHEDEVWTCSMHPQIRQPKPGKCPICFMDLVKVTGHHDDQTNPRQLTLSPAAAKLAEIQVVPVTRQDAAVEVRMVGKIAYDETRLAEITARVGGRLDRLYVDYTGIPVKTGDHLVYLYSPALVTAQEELLQALKTMRELADSDAGIVKDTTHATVTAAREKLRLWGLPADQVAAIEAEGKVQDHLTIYSPLSGIVINKHLNQGAYVKEGTPIYTIADLSHVWAQLDAYESDLAWLRFRQTVAFVAEAYPGKTFTGKIAFIDPVLNAATRTIKVRVNLENPDHLLKPGMFVRAIVRAHLTAEGEVTDNSLAGKWISPMHPEVISDHPGNCTVCGMPLVRAEDLGYARAEPANPPPLPLVVPASAPLLTGKRALVYIQTSPGKFEGRAVTLGPRAGQVYLVRDGLKEGDLVVVNGNFKIDSALQIQARPSMMNPETETAREPLPKSPYAQHGQRLAPVLNAYLKIQEVLAADRLNEARAAAAQLRQEVPKLTTQDLPKELQEVWQTMAPGLDAAGAKLNAANDLEAARQAFDTLSQTMIKAAEAFGVDRELQRVHCPMAFDNTGADWLQTGETVANPYFGEAMLRCGEIKQTLKP